MNWTLNFFPPSPCRLLLLVRPMQPPNNDRSIGRSVNQVFRKRRHAQMCPPGPPRTRSIARTSSRPPTGASRSFDRYAQLLILELIVPLVRPGIRPGIWPGIRPGIWPGIWRFIRPLILAAAGAEEGAQAREGRYALDPPGLILTLVVTLVRTLVFAAFRGVAAFGTEGSAQPLAPCKDFPPVDFMSSGTRPASRMATSTSRPRS